MVEWRRQIINSVDYVPCMLGWELKGGYGWGRIRHLQRGVQRGFLRPNDGPRGSLTQSKRTEKKQTWGFKANSYGLD